jgi:hypothetical protein
VYSLTVHEDRIFASYAAGVVYYSDDNGTAWTVLSPSLSSSSTVKLASHGNFLFAAAENIYLSEDNGVSWTTHNTGLYQPLAIDLCVGGGKLFSSQAGSGVWSRPLGEMLSCVASFSTSYDAGLNTFNLVVDPATVSAAIGYSWDFGDGSTSSLTYPTHVYAVDSVYKIRMTIYLASGDSCYYSDYVGISPYGSIVRSGGFTVTVSGGTSTALSSGQTGNSVLLWPNPTRDKALLKFSSIQKNTKVTVRDASGRTHEQLLITNTDQAAINSTLLAPGLYFISIDDGKTVHSKKLVITGN